MILLEWNPINFEMYLDCEANLNSCLITLKGNCQIPIFPPSQQEIKKLFLTYTTFTGLLWYLRKEIFFSGTDVKGIKAILPDSVPDANMYSFFWSKKVIEINFSVGVGFRYKHSSWV